MSFSSFKKVLLAGTALVAVASFSMKAQAGEVDDGNIIVATDAAGLIQSDDGADAAITIDSTGGAITLGADGGAAFSFEQDDVGFTTTINVTTSGVNNGVIFADDIVETNGDIVLNITNDDVTFQGNVGTLPITAGDGAGSTVNLIVDTANPENITFDADISAAAAGDTVNLNVQNGDGGAWTVDFNGAIGGATAATAVDDIMLDDSSDLDVTFAADVNASGAITIGNLNANTVDVLFEGDVTAASIDLNTDGGTANVSFGDGAGASAVTGDITGDGSANTIFVVGGSDVTFNGALTGTFDDIFVGADTFSTTATFTGNIDSGDITLGAGATAGDVNTVNFDTTGGPIAVGGNVDGGEAGDDNALNVSGGDVLTVQGNIGAGGAGFIDTIDLTDADTGLIAEGTLDATTVTLAADTTLTLNDTTTTTNISLNGAVATGGTVVLDDGNYTVTGTIDNDSGTAGVGTLTSNANGANTTTVDDAAGGVALVESLAAVNLTDTGILDFNSTVRATTITNEATGTIDIGGATNATTIVAEDSGFFIFGGTVTATNINLGDDALDDATVTLGAGVDVTSAITNTSSAVGMGTLTIDSTGGTTITGIVGGASATTSLKEINLGGAGAASFANTVRATDITFTGAGTANFADDVTGDIDFDGNDGIVNLASGQNITGMVDSTGGGNGTLNLLGGTQTISDDVGANGALVEVTAGVAAAVSNFSGIVTAADITVAGTGTVNFNGDVTGDLAFDDDGTVNLFDGMTFTGSIDSTNGSEGTLNFLGDGTVTVDIGAGDVLKTLTIAGTGNVVDVGGDMWAADTTTINSNEIDVVGAFETAAGQELNVTILTGAVGTETNGTIVADGNVTVDADTVLNLTVDAASGYIDDGATWMIVDGSNAAFGGVGTLTAGNITGSSLLISFEQDVADTDSLVIVADRTAMADVAGITPNGASVGTALDTIGNTGEDAPTTDGGVSLDAVQVTIAAAATVGELNEILEALIPTMDGSHITGVFDAGDMAMGLADVRMTSLMNGDDSMKGMAAGTSANGASMWLQGFGHNANQDSRNSIDGYDSTTWGGSIGADTTNVIDNGVVGLMVNYARTEADSENANRTDTEIDSYGANFYTSLNLEQQMFVNGQLGYSYNKIDTLRHDSDGVAGSGLNSRGDFDSSLYSARLDLGRDYGADYGLTVTPSVSASYSYLNVDGYTETGTGANLVVGSDTLNVLNLGFNVKAAWKLQNADGSILEPALRAGYAFDAIGDRIEMTNSFTGDPASTAFLTTGADPERSRLNAGAGLTYMTDANWDISANYDFTYKPDYDAHSGVMRMTAHF